MKLAVLTKDNRSIHQNDVSRIEICGGAVHIVLTDGSTCDIPLYLVDYLNIEL